MDQDLYTDLITISKDKKRLNFFLYNNEKGIFEQKIKEFSANENEEITSVKAVKIL